MKNEADVFGKLVMEKLRDVSIELSEGIVESRYESPGHKEIQNEIQSLSTKQKEIFLKCVIYCVDGGINDFVFNLDKELRQSGGIDMLIDSKNLKDLSPSLSQELYGEGGWQKRHSKYGSQDT
ncbi:hypothetical protein EHS89_16090 [Amphritea balenae]|uniref:Uncharacterized protein n=1 Tax=Amphritea balenae TaxID=452629 RepID=A0A3P1SL33_9GAMM|nr:hypothetical protein [Amphritea balenae]RRC97700.1 hypothetical protein EHS89_16090 [Amphritea balenae]